MAKIQQIEINQKNSRIKWGYVKAALYQCLGSNLAPQGFSITQVLDILENQLKSTLETRKPIFKKGNTFNALEKAVKENPFYLEYFKAKDTKKLSSIERVKQILYPLKQRFG